MKTKRPIPVTVLAFGVLIIAILFWVRFGKTITLRDVLPELPMSVGPGYLIFTGFLFGAAAIPIIWGLWFGKFWAPKGVLAFFIALTIYYWSDRIAFTISDAAQSNTPFAIGANLVLLLAIGFVINMPQAKSFFGKHGAFYVERSTTKNSSTT